MTPALFCGQQCLALFTSLVSDDPCTRSRSCLTLVGIYCNSGTFASGSTCYTFPQYGGWAADWNIKLSWDSCPIVSSVCGLRGYINWHNLIKLCDYNCNFISQCFHRGQLFYTNVVVASVFWMVVFNMRLAGNRQWISHISGGARLNVIRVGNHLLQIYNSLLIAFLTLNLTMKNDCIWESSYRRLTLPIFPLSP